MAAPTHCLGPVEDFPAGTTRLARAEGRRLVVIATETGFTVADAACPHEGYSLVQGDVEDGTLVCAWHNWRFRLGDGRCLKGEEDLRTHATEVRDGQLHVALDEPDPAIERTRLLASLRRGLDDGYVGQMSRDIVRLLRADADPVQVVWEAVAWGLPRAEFGFGHAMASLVDCLAMTDRLDGDARALPVAAAFAGVAETERRRPLREQPAPATSLPKGAFRDRLEATALEDAEALLRGLIATGDLAGARRWLIRAVTDHQLSYGHGAIYVQKAFELLERLGDDRADAVLPHLVPALGWATRQDRLPYMRPFMRALANVDPAAFADAPTDPGWTPASAAGQALHAATLGQDAASLVAAASAAVRDGAGVEGLLDVTSGVAAHRLLRYDPAAEVASAATDFGWLDITHVLTYTAAARWAWRADPGPHTARLALFCLWLGQYAGRRGYVEGPAPEDAAAPSADALFGEALGDGAGSFIVAAHLVKTSWAASTEAAATGSSAPLAAAARLVASPRRERFVALNVRKALDLADGRIPA